MASYSAQGQHTSQNVCPQKKLNKKKNQPS